MLDSNKNNISSKEVNEFHKNLVEKYGSTISLNHLCKSTDKMIQMKKMNLDILTKKNGIKITEPNASTLNQTLQNNSSSHNRYAHIRTEPHYESKNYQHPKDQSNTHASYNMMNNKQSITFISSRSSYNINKQASPHHLKSPFSPPITFTPGGPYTLPVSHTVNNPSIGFKECNAIFERKSKKTVHTGVLPDCQPTTAATHLATITHYNK